MQNIMTLFVGNFEGTIMLMEGPEFELIEQALIAKFYTLMTIEQLHNLCCRLASTKCMVDRSLATCTACNSNK